MLPLTHNYDEWQAFNGAEAWFDGVEPYFGSLTMPLAFPDAPLVTVILGANGISRAESVLSLEATNEEGTVQHSWFLELTHLNRDEALRWARRHIQDDATPAELLQLGFRRAF